MAYTSLSYIEDLFGDRITFGTEGTNILTEEQGTMIINRVSKYIDFELQNLYGTYEPLFGTNNLGTLDVPQIIKDIATDLTVGMLYQNTWLSLTEEQRQWGLDIYNRGIEMLNKIKNGERLALPFAGTIDNGLIPHFNLACNNVYGEVITLEGTKLVELNNRKVIKKDFKVYGTELENPVQYQEGTHYNMFFYGEENTGTNYGYIKGITEGTLTVRVDYKYLTNRIFYINDYLKWGESGVEHR